MLGLLVVLSGTITSLLFYYFVFYPRKHTAREHRARDGMSK